MGHISKGSMNEYGRSERTGHRRHGRHNHRQGQDDSPTTDRSPQNGNSSSASQQAGNGTSTETTSTPTTQAANTSAGKSTVKLGVPSYGYPDGNSFWNEVQN